MYSSRITVKQYFNRIQIFIKDTESGDDILVMDYWDENPLLGGRVGVQAKNSLCYFDNLEVTTGENSALGEGIAVEFKNKNKAFINETREDGEPMGSFIITKETENSRTE